MTKTACARLVAAAGLLFGALVLTMAWLQAGGTVTLDPPGFHHLHLNAADPDAEIAFYTRHFQSVSRGEILGLPAVRSGQVAVLFTVVSKPPVAEPQSAYWHFGWHVPDSRAYWKRYLSSGAPLVPLYTDAGTTVTSSLDWWAGLLTKAQIPSAVARGMKTEKNGFGYLRGPGGELVEFQGDLPAERFNHVHMFQDDVFCAELWYRRHLNAGISPGSRRGMRAGDPTWKPLDVTESDCRVPIGEPSWLSLVPEGTRRQPAGGVIFDDVEMNWYQRQSGARLVSSKGQVIDHVGLSVTNLAAWQAKLRQERVKILAGPYRLGPTQAFMVEGPSREVIELVEVR